MLTPAMIAKMLDHSTLQPWLTEEDIRSPCATKPPLSAPARAT